MVDETGEELGDGFESQVYLEDGWNGRKKLEEDWKGWEDA